MNNQTITPNESHHAGMPTKTKLTATLVGILLLVSAYEYFLNLLPGEHARAFVVLLTTPGQWGMALAYGTGTLLFPAVHIAIASIFKSKRNGNTRCNILIGWGLFILSTKILFIAVGR